MLGALMDHSPPAPSLESALEAALEHSEVALVRLQWSAGQLPPSAAAVRALQRRLRRGDVVHGQDDGVVLLCAGSSPAGASQLARRLVVAVSEARLTSEAGSSGISTRIAHSREYSGAAELLAAVG